MRVINFLRAGLAGSRVFRDIDVAVPQQQSCCAPLFFLPAASAPVARSARRRVYLSLSPSSWTLSPP